MDTDKLAKHSNGKTELSNNRSVSLDEVLLRFRLRYRAEMGDLELADWLETLRLYPLREVVEAMDYLMHNPPKQVLPDGTTQEWRGFPTLIDLREKRAADWHRKQWERSNAELKELEKERAKNPEKFFGWADLMKEFGEKLLRKS
jgi:hypothetical protein